MAEQGDCPCLAALLGAALVSCSAGTILSIADVLTQGGDDGSLSGAETALSHLWDVISYSGDAMGAVTISGGTRMSLRFRSDHTFTLTSSAPLPAGGAASATWDEAGGWAVTDPGAGRMLLRLTRHQGTDIDPAQWVDVLSTFRADGNNLILTTTAFKLGLVRFVMRRGTDVIQVP
ncbi:MAG: hypothetical protein HYU66_04765 [Armatimonadetes bacterium]|nr:hypothetical protein [Armatimonadota bacterium]